MNSRAASIATPIGPLLALMLFLAACQPLNLSGAAGPSGPDQPQDPALDAQAACDYSGNQIVITLANSGGPTEPAPNPFNWFVTDSSGNTLGASQFYLDAGASLTVPVSGLGPIDFSVGPTEQSWHFECSPPPAAPSNTSPPQPTDTPVPPTATSTASPRPARTRTPTATPTFTSSPTATATVTPTGTATSTATTTRTPIPTRTNTPTAQANQAQSQSQVSPAAPQPPVWFLYPIKLAGVILTVVLIVATIIIAIIMIPLDLGLRVLQAVGRRFKLVQQAIMQAVQQAIKQIVKQITKWFRR